MNFIGFKTIYKKEMLRTFRVLLQTIVSPVLTTVLYFIVFGAAIGSKVAEIDGISYAQFIVPGLIMMSLLTNSLGGASSGIYFPKFLGSIYELLSAPLSSLEIVLSYTLASVTRAMLVGIIIYIVALFFTELPVLHPFYAFGFAFLTSFTFALFGLIIGIWADSFEKLNIFPLLILTPLSFLGGVFYSLDMLPEFWQKFSLINPVVYMISGLRWSFFGISEIDPQISLLIITLFLVFCFGILYWIFKTGYKLKS